MSELTPMFKITGLDDLTKTIDEAQKAFADLDGQLGKVNFDPNDPASIQAAINDMERAIDARAGQYQSNPMVAPLIEGLKERVRDHIVSKAAAARLKDLGSTTDETQ